MNDKNDTRWGNWMGRARTCFRAATAIDTSTTAVTSTVRELEAAGADELVVQLREAEAALARARDAVQGRCRRASSPRPTAKSATASRAELIPPRHLLSPRDG